MEKKAKKAPPKWIPDWKDKSNYNHLTSVNEISNKQWAWEFIRRNPEYQRLYIKFIKSDVSFWRRDNNKDKPEFSDYVQCTPNAYAKESYAKYMTRIAGSDSEQPCPSFSPKNSEILERFPFKNLSKALNPKNNKPPKFRYAREYPYVSKVKDGKFLASKTLKGDDEVLMIFSLKHSLNKQLQSAKKHLSSEQSRYASTPDHAIKEECKIHYSNLVLYLGYLDADAKGHSVVEITNFLSTSEKPVVNESTVRKGLKQAKRFRDGEYMKFLKYIE